MLLAILLLNASEVVSSDRLIDELWGQAAPETAAKALQVHVSQLRKALEPEREAGEPPRFLVAAERSASLLTEALEEYRTLGMEPWERRAERALDEAGVRQRASR